MAYMCARPGKILSPNRLMVLHSPSTLTVEERKRNRYRLKLAIRQAIDDMIEILESGDKKATTFLISDLERLLDYCTWLDARQAQHAGSCRLGRSGGAPLVWQGGGQ